MCSTKSFTTAYETAPGLVYPATLMSMLPNINSRFQKGGQQCAAEFFQEYCRCLGYRFNECQSNGFIPQHIDLSYLKTFFFNLRSEILCLKCNTVSCNSSMETLLPLHLGQVTTIHTLLSFCKSLQGDQALLLFCIVMKLICTLFIQEQCEFRIKLRCS